MHIYTRVCTNESIDIKTDVEFSIQVPLLYIYFSYN